MRDGDQVMDRLTYRVSEVARLTGLPRSTIYGLLRSGMLECIQVGRGVLVPADELEAFLERNRHRRMS